jgi:peptidoglycan L-alanyl-D-glutamate endopeptidase CwlK
MYLNMKNRSRSISNAVSSLIGRRFGYVLSALTVFAILAFFCNADLSAREPADGASLLIQAYPSHLKTVSGNHIVWNDGTTMLYDDGKTSKSFDELLDSPDLEDQMAMQYPVGAGSDYRPPVHFDPGRVRYEPFFRKMYGSSEAQVKKNLVTIKWMPKTSGTPILVTKVNGINEKLQKISRELDTLPDDLKKYVKRISGTFNWRRIAGTNRLSMHSFGIAVDMNAKYANYWRWDSKGNNGQYVYKNDMPFEIVRIFEKYGFIWGGRWYHYDTMHFEYRPELLPGTSSITQ